MTVSIRCFLAAILVAAASGFAVSGSEAAGGDPARLHVAAPSIDGQLTFASTSGWSWTCPRGARSCSVNTYTGRTITITAQSGSASPFQSWGGACAGFGTQPVCTVQVTGDTEVTARFARLRVWMPTFGYGSVEWGPATSGGAPLVGRSCGGGCVDLPTGSAVRFHARPADGAHRLSAWGGDCARFRSASDCVLTLNDNVTVGASFELIPPPSDCKPGQSCDPVDPAMRYRILVKGNGLVYTPQMKTIAGQTCKSYTSNGSSCEVDRPIQKTVYFVASPVGFQGWGGACLSQGRICKIYTKPGSSTNILALFA